MDWHVHVHIHHQDYEMRRWIKAILAQAYNITVVKT